jgi:PelA/Pel-15E family pectate lyase
MKPFALFLALAVCLPGSILTSAAAKVRWSAALRQSDTWYASPEARTLAESVLRYQTPDGGWPKNTDMTDPPSVEFLANHAMDHRDATIDNNATTPQLRFFARFVTVTNDAKFRAAFEHGFDYLLAAQYPNGGWPQYFPLREGYYTHITYNDNAMVNVLGFLREAAKGKPLFAFIDQDRRDRATAAVAKGIDCILKTQVKQNGTLTVWCAQHDEKTLAPVWARKFEPPSLSGGESVGIVRFLMSLDKPSPEIIAAVEGAVAWFDKVKITGMRVEDIRDGEGKPDHRLTPDPRADPVWARFYELGTDRPIFVGRDSVVHYAYAEIERERRSGYGYYGTWAKSLIKSDYAHWRKRVGLPARAVTPVATAKP